MSFPLPPNEPARLAALQATGLLDSAPEQEYDDLTRLAGQICGAPSAAVSLVDTDRQWFKAKVGLPFCETEREAAFCAHTILDATLPLVVPDVTLDPRFADNPLVLGDPFIRFYAGVPLITKEGHAIGTLCVLDSVPRTLASHQIEGLQMLGRLVMRLVEARQLQATLEKQRISLRAATSQLRRQQSELRVLFDFLPAMIAFKDTENHLLRVNRQMAESLGRPLSELEGRSLQDILPDKGEAIYAADLEIIRSGQPQLGRIESFIGSDGSERWAQKDKVPVLDEDGRVTGLVVMVQDITARKLAEETLQQRQTELQILFDLLPAVVCFKDTRNHYLRVNQAAAAKVGRRVEEIVGRSAAEVFPAEADRIFAEDQEVIRTGRPKLGVVESRRDAHGREFWIQTDRVPYRDSAGHVIGVVVMAQDISDRKTAEAALKERLALQERLTRIATTVPGIIYSFLLRPDGTACLPYISPTMEEFYGVPTDNLAEDASPIFSVIHEEDRPRIRQSIAESGRTMSAWRDEFRLRHPRKGLIWVEGQSRPEALPDGAILWHGFMSDVTERKAAEAELVRAREAALETGRLKSRFLANMSHELRTPLNTINGLAATLLEQELPAHLTSPVGLILQCGETLLQNIQTILTHSSLESGRFSLEARPFSPAEVALNALRMTGDRARRKGLVLDYYLDPSMPAVVDGDAFRLQQVIVNFLANAIKFTDAGRVSLRVRALRRHDRVDLRFTVADSGLGIPADELAQLFTPFAQADNSGVRRFEGTGLGLAISKTLVDLMGGSVGAHSRPGTGSFFYCTVPFLVEDQPRPLGAATAHASLAGRLLLVEEDRPLRRRMLLELARAWNLRATVVPDAAATARLVADQPFDFAVRPGGSTPAVDAYGAALPAVWLCAGTIPAADPGRTVGIADLFGGAELSAALAQLLAPATAGRRSAAPDGSAPRKLGERIPLRILSADDIATNRDMLSFMCRHLGYRTDLVVDGVELLEQIARQTYDLLLVDVNMPRMDGLTAAREICRLIPDPAKRPRLVAVTANALSGDRERCLAAGMDDYISKPLVPKNLVACIERLFSEARAATAAAPAPVAPALPPAAPLVDPEYLRTVTDGIELADAADFLVSLRDSVIRDYDALRAPLAAACTARQGPELEKIVHGLKGCFLSIGWARLGGRCAAAMAALRAGRFQDWTTLADEIHSLQQESTAALNQRLAGPTTPPTARETVTTL